MARKPGKARQAIHNYVTAFGGIVGGFVIFLSFRGVAVNRLVAALALLGVVVGLLDHLWTLTITRRLGSLAKCGVTFLIVAAAAWTWIATAPAPPPRAPNSAFST
jgi:hypothetical protein